MVKDDNPSWSFGPDSPTVLWPGMLAADDAGSPAPGSAKLPERIGRYKIEQALGEGGFGLVYLAYDDQLKRHVVVKVPRADRLAGPDDASRYLEEASKVAQLDHPHIVPVHDVGSTNEFACFIVSKFIDGYTLKEKIRQARPSVHEAAELVATVADALHYAHKQGIVHRDVKPGNILIDKQGRPFVVDFGLALRDRDIGKDSGYAGTPPYMSPEQARGEGHRVDGRSDVFSLGVVLYELLLGRRPFHGDSQDELLGAITSVEPKPPRQTDDQIPRELERICLKALSKRATERYTTAKDLGDDLRHFLNQTPVAGGPRQAISESFAEAVDDTTVTGAAAAPLSDTRPIRIVPKGLRSFDEHDSDFFLELLPGPRDRDGLPDSIRFWKARIEELDADKTFSVGLIYGPSGCGKSSLVKAGLLPRLGQNVLPVYVEAAANQTEIRLLNGLRKRIANLPAHLGLKEALAALRRGQGIAQSQKVLIVLDQFEQWLHASNDEQHAELVQSLRQCDGEHVQCVLMVRDDFWLAVSRFLNGLEVDLHQGRNFALIDLFDCDHARQVLAAFGTAFGRLPEDPKKTSTDQQEFLTQSIAGLAEDERVVSVRLALFAEMMKGRPWTPASLKDVGGTTGVGVTFLEETFSTRTNPNYGLHQKAARAVLKALLPESGTNIKGHMRSAVELLGASGYADRRRDFEDLLRILDGELRLITPTDPEGAAGDGESSTETRVGQKYYQLTHDYLVPSLREWLTRKRKETRRGRAELRLAERAALWSEKRENRHLPSWWEYLTFLALVPAKNRTDAQQKMLAQARRVQATRWGSALALVTAVILAIAHVVSTERREKLQGQTITAVDAVQNNRGSAVPFTIRNLEKLPRDMVVNELKSRYAEADPHRKLGLAYALAEYGLGDSPYLCSQISQSAPEEVDNFVAAFTHDRDASLSAVQELEAQCQSARDWRLRTRLAVVALHLGDDRIAADMCRIDDRPDPVQRTIFIDEFPAWHGDLAKLGGKTGTVTDPALQSALCMAVGSVPVEPLDPADIAAWKPIVSEWHQTVPDNVTHSAAGWALRQWKVALALPASSSPPDESRDWYLNSLGMTILKIRPGRFVRRDYHSGTDLPNAKPQTVDLSQAFFLCDREVTNGQYRQFVDDPQCPNEEKPADLPDRRGTDDSSSYPQVSANWYDAVLFCNWLSRREGLAPCYERTGKKHKVGEREYDEWRLAANGTGYRLPTEAEWEYACRAGTTTDFASGTDADLLRKYAVYTTGTTRGTFPCGSKLPNGWGLFDMHGNVWEWCYDWYARYDAEITFDPAGPLEPPSAEAPNRVVRGGSWGIEASLCRSAVRGESSPGGRSVGCGFRLARSASVNK